MFVKKTILFFLVIGSFQLTRAQDTIWMEDLQYDQENYIFYKSGTDKPFSGNAYKITSDYTTIGVFVTTRFHLVKGKVRFITGYYPSGKKWSTMKYGAKGPAGNQYTEYYENGKRKKYTKFQTSNKLKIWKYWNSNGKLCKIEKFNIEETLVVNKKFGKGCEN